MELSQLVVKLVTDVTQYRAGLATAEADVESFSSRAVSGLATLGGGIVMGVGILAAAGVTAVGLLAKSAIQDAEDAQDTEAQLAANLKNTGDVTGVTAKQVNDLALSYSSVTRYSKDMVMAGGTVISGFKQINSDVFPETLQLSLDLATKWKTDVPSAATILSKALADPGVGLLKLKTAGVVFTTQQEEMIKSMQKAGDTAGAQALMLDVVNQAVGGSAEEAGTTAAGIWDRLKNIWTTVLTTLGTGLLPTITNVGQAIVNYLAKPETQAFIATLAQRIAEFAQTVVNYFPVVVQWFQTAFGWLQGHQGVIVAALAAIGAAVLVWVYTVVIPAAIAMITAIAPVILIMAAIGLAAYLIYQAWTTNWGGIQEKTAAVIAWLVNAFNNVMAVIVAIWNNPLLQMTIQTILTNIQLIVRLFQDAMSGNWTAFGQTLRMIWDNDWHLIEAVVQTAWTTLNGLVKSLIVSIVNFFYTTDWGAVGKNIIQGIANGITSSLSWIVNAAKKAAQAAMAAAKGFLGINSPSKEAENQLGLPFGQGMGIGIQKSLNAVSGNMPGYLSGMLNPSFANSISGIGPSAGGGGTPIIINNPTFFGTDQYEVARVMEPAVDLLLRRKGLK